MQRANSLVKTLMLRKIERRRRRGQQRMRWLDGTIDSMDMSLANSGRWWRTGNPGVLQSMGSQRVRHDWESEQQQQAYFCHKSPVHTWEGWLCTLCKSIFFLPFILSPLVASLWFLNTIKFWSSAVNLTLFLYPQVSTYSFSLNQDTFSLRNYNSV